MTTTIRTTTVTIFLLTLLGLCPLSRSARGADAPPTLRVQPKVHPFDLDQVRLLDGPFRDAMLRNKAYLLTLEPDRLLHTFRLTAGLPTTAQPYGGWEEPKCELRGHCMGHYLSACALMYASTGDPQLKTRIDLIVAELAACQQALLKQGYNKGYLSAFPESFIDRVETRKPVWAPWYTLHKIMAGLLDSYQYCGNTQALDVLKKNADWVKFRVDRLTPQQMQASLETEFGGMNEVLANLYAITGNPDHLRLAKAFDHDKIFEPLSKGQDKLDGLHANTQIPKMIGAAREYELTGDTRYRDIATFFWQRVALFRSYAIGGHSDREHFFPINQFAQHLSPETAETCNTYNMLKLTRHMMMWDPSPTTADFYERALYNHILASQDPEKAMFVYLMSLKPGHFKTYSTPDNSFWCCVGTGMENHGKYADSIYFHDADSLYVNLFIASTLTWKEKGLVIRQETRFPEEDTTALVFKCDSPVDLALQIRHPAWATAGATLTLNDQKLETPTTPGSYITIKRQWKEGDRLEVRFPMTLHIEPLHQEPLDNSSVAILYGPIVLAGQLGAEKMPTPYARNQTDHSRIPSPTAPAFVIDGNDILSHIQPVPDQPLTFQTKGLAQPAEITLIPLYRLHHQRYSVYWKVYSPQQWKAQQTTLAAAEARRKDLEARMVDVVFPGEQQSETDHGMQGDRTNSGDLFGRKWRDARGYFSWRLKVIPNTPLALVCTYWGSDGGRTFDILIDGTKLATQTLNNNKPGEFFDVEYPIPANLIQGKEKITIRFQAVNNGIAGGAFGCAVKSNH